MGQTVKRKKKGRPSKADLARRRSSVEPSPEPELRRSLRRRNVKYNIDYDDYLEDDFDDEEEDERRREKKLKLVLKLDQDESASARGGRAEARDCHAQENGVSDEDEEEKPSKKRKINGEEAEEDGDDDEEERGPKGDSKVPDSTPGTPADHPSGLPLPDKKTLELILDKLQKKDTYGVYAEPVDPEELPDYHDIIEHPMDFATVRKKLASGSYATMEQLESDVFLICSNAMQYNSPDTIYHKQARAIQELARKKFQKLRFDMERSEKELKYELKTNSNSMVKKPIKKPMCRISQEQMGSDFSSGATLATAIDGHNGSNPSQPGGWERLCNNNDGYAEGNPSLNDTSIDKAEELSSGKALALKLGRKPSGLEENRRATYNISSQPDVRSDSIFSTFEDEVKQLVAVGLHAEYSYARSLARFAATLGPVAWKVASRRIQQALPAGLKFGRGWVGEYEPLPNPIQILENRSRRESPLVKNLQCSAVLNKDGRSIENQLSAKEPPVNEGPPLGGKTHPFRFPSGPNLEGKPSMLIPPGLRPSSHVHANYPAFTEPQSKVSKQVELNSLPSSSRNNPAVSEKQPSGNSETRVSKAGETASRNLNLQPQPCMPFKNQDSNGAGIGGLPNENVTSNYLGNRMINPDSGPSQRARSPTQFPYGQQQGLSDPVQIMRMLAEKTQKQQKSSDQSSSESPAMPSIPAVREDPNNAAVAAARAWMSIGAGGFKQAMESSARKNQISADSLYNPTREFHLQNLQGRGGFPVSGGIQLQPEKNGFPVQAFAPQPVRIGNEVQFQNRPMVFSNAVTADLSRFQMLPPWRGPPPQTQPTQSRQKQETLPPDLNIGFQAPGSPARQSSSAAVDSQQPDLALQL